MTLEERAIHERTCPICNEVVPVEKPKQYSCSVCGQYMLACCRDDLTGKCPFCFEGDTDLDEMDEFEGVL